MRNVAGALVALVVAACSTIAAPLATAAPLAAGSSAVPISSCTSSAGTIIAVDYSHWSGPIVRGCDTSNPKRGIDLLTDTGFTTTGTQHDGPQFLCRIGNRAFGNGTQYPTPSSESCVVTPPASAYWSYWLAPAGQDHWTYSQLGAYAEVPKKGEVELWIFGGTNVAGTTGGPSCSPASLRAGGSATGCSGAVSSQSTTHPPKHAAKSAAARGGGSTRGGSTRGGSTRGGSTRGGSNDAGSNGDGSTGGGSNAGSSGDGSNPRAGSTGSATTHRSGDTSGTDQAPQATRCATRQRTSTPPAVGNSASAGSRAARECAAHPQSDRASTAGAAESDAPGSVDALAAGQIVNAQPVSTKQPSAGSAVPLAIGVGLALVLAAGGGVTMWRRRQSE